MVHHLLTPTHFMSCHVMQVMFSRPLPGFSCRLNAFATALTCQWLMGPCKVNDAELDDGTVSESVRWFGLKAQEIKGRGRHLVVWWY